MPSLSVDRANNPARQRSPWAWIPTLYFAQGLPYVAVMTISVIMYKRLGISNTDIALYTGWLYLPWVIKPFWSPMVDILRTKRWWVLAMQFVIALTLAAIALTIPAPFFFQATLCVFWLMALASATHDIAADGYYMIALTEHQQSWYVGIRSTFYRVATVVGQGVLVILAGTIEESSGDVPWAWTVTFAILSLFFLAVAVYHSCILPREARDVAKHNAEVTAQTGTKGFASEFVMTFRKFFSKPHIWAAIAFMLLYRLPEAQMVKLISPFLLDSHAVGGMGMTTAQVGLAYGTVGIIGLTVGGIVGGIIAARYGLKRCLQPMAWSMSLTCLPILFLSLHTAAPLWVINLCVVIEQFGYGFGFTAYMLYLIYFSEGEFKTAHYALCTGFMALSMMLPGMAAGWLQETLGYVGFFIWTCACCAATIGAATFIKVDPTFGLKGKKAE